MRHGNKTKNSYQGMLYTICLFGILASVLTACAPQTVIPSQLPTNTSTKPKPSEKSTPNPTATLQPTLTITPTSRPNKYTALASEFNVPKSCVTPHLYSNEIYSISIDQNWIAANCSLYEELVMSNKISGRQIKIRYKEIESEVPDNFLIHPLSWSSDNKYLYFTTRCCESDDQKNSNGSLYQYDLEQESWAVIIRGLYEPFYFFSANGERYIYLNHHKNETDFYPEYLEIGMVDIVLNKNKRVVLLMFEKSKSIN